MILRGLLFPRTCLLLRHVRRRRILPHAQGGFVVRGLAAACVPISTAILRRQLELGSHGHEAPKVYVHMQQRGGSCSAGARAAGLIQVPSIVWNPAWS